MNFYPHHIGDYSKDTSHLSMVEDGAYRRLMDRCYATEKPLPLDPREIYRVARANTATERKAVDAVLAEFFCKEDDGYHQKRCDEELALFREDNADKQAKNENERERQRRHRARRKELFASLRERGIVPKWDTPIDELETLLSRTDNAPVTPPVTRTATANHNHEPITSNQEPRTNIQKEHHHHGPGNGKSAPPHANGVVVVIPLSEKQGWTVPPDFLHEMESAYPAVDGPATLREIRAWCVANPGRVTDESGAKRFINSWFERTQNA